MIMDGDYVAILTPKKLHIMQNRTLGDGVVDHSFIATFGLDKPIWGASLAFCQGDDHPSVQICISNSDVFFYRPPPLVSFQKEIPGFLSFLILEQAN